MVSCKVLLIVLIQPSPLLEKLEASLFGEKEQ